MLPCAKIILGRPPALPADFSSCFTSHGRPSFSEIQELAGKNRLHTTDERRHRRARPSTDSTPLRLTHSARWGAWLVLNDESICIYMSLLMCPWVMQACQSTTSCHLGTTNARICFWWIGMDICTRWWLRDYLAIRWPIIEAPARWARRFHQHRFYRPPSSHASR